MSATGFESIDHTVQLTHIWINELDDALGWQNKPRAFRLLRSVLHALRDWLQVNEAVDLAAQLPTLVRGIYYDQWRPSAVPVKERRRDDFLARVDRDFKTDPIDNTAEAVTAVFRLLSEKVTAGEISDVRNALPADLRALWPVPAKAA